MLKMYVKCMMVVNRFKENKKGQGMVEYGLIIGLIAVAVIVAVTLLGGNISNLFTGIANKLDIVVP